MGVKIGETYTTTVELKSLITYTCVNCRTKQIGEYNVEAESVAAASIMENGQRIAANNQINAVEMLFAIDDANRDNVNNNHNYLCLKHPIKCRNCNTVQPWSDETEHPVKKKISPPLISICIMMRIFALATLRDGLWSIGFICLLISGSIIFYYAYNNKRYKDITTENEKITNFSVIVNIRGLNVTIVYTFRPLF